MTVPGLGVGCEGPGISAFVSETRDAIAVQFYWLGA